MATKQSNTFQGAAGGSGGDGPPTYKGAPGGGAAVDWTVGSPSHYSAAGNETNTVESMPLTSGFWTKDVVNGGADL